MNPVCRPRTRAATRAFSVGLAAAPRDQSSGEGPLLKDVMGCVFAKKRKSQYHCDDNSNGVKVYDLRSQIDTIPTVIDESSSTVLRYKTPYFRASARIRFPPVGNTDLWKIGWVQACTHMEFVNTYGEYGISSWEIPTLKGAPNQQYISDSDGRCYPFYGGTTEMASIQGPTTEHTYLHVNMNDNFYPSITWDIPVGNTTDAKLTHIHRDQSFTVWLLAINQTTQEYSVLKTIKWQMQLQIAVDPEKALGSRATLVSPVKQKEPKVLRNNESFVPPKAMLGPNANEAQMLIWWPRMGTPSIIVPPKYSSHQDN